MSDDTSPQITRISTKICIYVFVMFSMLSTLHSHIIPENFKTTIMATSPKNWFKFILKCANECLKRNFVWNMEKKPVTYRLLLGRQWRKLKSFLKFANQTVSMKRLGNADFSTCYFSWASPGSFQTATICRSEQIILVSGQIKHQIQSRGRVKMFHFSVPLQPGYFTEKLILCYKFILPGTLRMNLSVTEMTAGVARFKCGTGQSYSFVSVDALREPCDQPFSDSAHIFCGRLSQYNFFPGTKSVRMVFTILPELYFHIHVLFQVLDSFVIETYKVEMFSFGKFKAIEYLPSAKSCMRTALVQVKKFKTVLLKVRKSHQIFAAVYDGPDISSALIPSAQKSTISTTSYQCLIFTVQRNTPKQLKISYSARDLITTQHMTLTHYNTTLFQWYPFREDTSFQYSKSVLVAQKHHTIMVNITLFDYSGKENIHCLYSGVAAFDVDEKESLLYCQRSDDFASPKNLLYSATIWLMLLVYQYNKYSKVKLKIEIEQVHCNSVQLNSFCHESLADSLITAARFTNLSFKVSHSGSWRFSRFLHFSLPPGECGILQILSHGEECTVHLHAEPLVHRNSYKTRRPIFYTFTGASKVLSDTFRINHKTLVFHGEFEYMSENVQSKIDSANSTMFKLMKASVKPFYDQYHVQFKLMIATEQSIFVHNEFHTTITSMYWSIFWVNIMFWNSTLYHIGHGSNMQTNCANLSASSANAIHFVPLQATNKRMLKDVPHLKNLALALDINCKKARVSHQLNSQSNPASCQGFVVQELLANRFLMCT